MRSSVIAFFLSACTVTFTAAATESPDGAQARPPAAKQTAVRPAASRPTAELITTAGAVTNDGPPSAQASPAGQKVEGDKPRRTGSAMLLAALALMSGIALRRYSARDQ